MNALTGKSVFAPKKPKKAMVQQRAPSLTAEVDAELTKHADVVAYVNDQSGDVQTFLPPKAPTAASFRSLTAEERKTLEAERQQLIQGLRSLVWADRVRAELRIKEIQRALDVGRFDDESDRRHQERREERRRELGQQ